ncbi:MAG: patatin-like phospholipase family protein [Acidimicrobiales bacterium]
MPDASTNGHRALVLGGGGVAGIAWEIGILARMAELEIDLAADAELVVGTSAGACVGALVTGQSGYDKLTATQRLPVSQTRERIPDFDLNLLVEIFGLMTSVQDDPAGARREIGALAMATKTVPEDERREIIAWRMPNNEWPARRLVITAVDAETGERVTFDASSAVSLVDAVAASCAVPGVWPPVTIGGKRYIDGGVYSTTNVDLAQGCDRTVVLRPVAMGPIDDDGERAEATNLSRPPLIIAADAESLAAFGPNLLDPASRGAALDAGMLQADEVATDVRQYWTSSNTATSR